MRSTYKYSVFCTLQFEATHHCPPEVCPKDVQFLTNDHRHIFHVHCEVQVLHDNRDIEFISYKRRIQDFIRKGYDRANLGTKSCEQIAREIMDEFPLLDKVIVSEDGENGAIVTRGD